jgi:hypothetical protein
MKDIPASFRHIRLLLAREKGHPGGDDDHGYDIVAPLGPAGKIDVETFKAHRDTCRVRRFRPDEDDAVGKLVHGPGGRWSFEYDDSRTDDDEVAFRLGDETFAVGEYISIREDDGEMHTFVVAQVNEV